MTTTCIYCGGRLHILFELFNILYVHLYINKYLRICLYNKLIREKLIRINAQKLNKMLLT